MILLDFTRYKYGLFGYVFCTTKFFVVLVEFGTEEVPFKSPSNTYKYPGVISEQLKTLLMV